MNRPNWKHNSVHVCWCQSFLICYVWTSELIVTTCNTGGPTDVCHGNYVRVWWAVSVISSGCKEETKSVAFFEIILTLWKTYPSYYKSVILHRIAFICSSLFSPYEEDSLVGVRESFSICRALFNRFCYLSLLYKLTVHKSLLFDAVTCDAPRTCDFITFIQNGTKRFDPYAARLNLLLETSVA